MSGSRDRRTSVDVHETPDAFKISMRLTGVDADAINISGFGNTLTVSGDLREEWQEEDDGGRWVLRAQNFGAFERVLTLTTAIVSDAAATKVANGVLTIALPKLAGRLP